MFGTWLSLLDSGGPRWRNGPKADYETLWRNATRKAFPGARAEAKRAGRQATRTWAYSIALNVSTLRNRAAHHEPLVNGFPLPGQDIRLSAEEGHLECLKLARAIDRDLAEWLAGNTKVPTLLARRP